jgi:hypothetical protein
VVDVVELDEVKLRAPPIVDYGDTINYSVGAFRSQQDRVIADVLNKLPGIDVDGDGRVSYMGEPIEKYYIDGLDLLEGRYNLANNNLPAGAVSDIQILENHQPIRIYDSMVYSGKASLNIKLKKDVTLTGSAALVGGFAPALWEANVSPMLFNKKQQLIGSFQSNNTGKSLVKELQSFRNTRANWGAKDYLLAVQGVNQPPFNDKFWLANESHLGSLNYLRKLNDTWQVKGNINYLDANSLLNGNTETQIFTLSDTIQIVENKMNDFSSRVLKGELFLEKNRSDSYYKQHIAINSTLDQGLGRLALSNQADFDQGLSQTHFQLENNISAIKKAFGSLISLQSNTIYTENEEVLTIDPPVFLDAIGNVGDQNSVQNLGKAIFKSSNQVSLSKRKGFFLFKSELGLNVLSESLNTWVNNAPSIPALSNDLSLILFAPYVNVNTEYSYKKWVVTMDAPLIYRDFMVSDMQKETPESSFSRLNFEPQLEIHYDINNFWKVNFSTGITNDFGNVNSIHPGYILKSYRDLQRYETPLEEIQSKTIGGNIQHRNPIKAFFLSFRYRYGLMTNSIQKEYSYAENGATVISTLEKEVDANRQMASVDASKYFRQVKTTLYGSATLMQLKDLRVLNSSLSTIENVNLNYDVGLRGTIFTFIDYDYAFQQSYLSNTINEGRTDPLRRDKHEIALDFLLNDNQYVGLAFQANNNIISGESTGLNNFMNLSYNYFISKIGLDLTAEWRNVFDNKFYTTVYSDANNYIVSSFEMRPMQFLIKAQFSLNNFGGEK